MYLYVEEWNVTEEWMDLSKEDRKDYMKKVTSAVGELSKSGVENLGWAINDEHTPHRSDYRYIAVWKFPSLELVEEFEKSIEEADWHTYFSQVNGRGKILSLNDALDYLINLEANTTSII